MLDESVLEFYNYCRGKHGSGSLGKRHGWPSLEGQQIRFGEIINILKKMPETHEATILDFGCGTGELFVYLFQAGVGAHYIGVDGLEQNIRDAHQLLNGFPGSYELHHFFWDGVAEFPFPVPVDVVVESGAFGTIPREVRHGLFLSLLGIVGDVFVGNFFRKPKNLEIAPGVDPLDWRLHEVESLVDHEVFEGKTYVGYVPDDFTVCLKRRM